MPRRTAADHGGRPRIAVVNDYELVVAGVAAMLAPYSNRITLGEAILIDEPVVGPPVDVALFDTFAREGLEMAALEKLLADDNVKRVALYTGAIPEQMVQMSIRAGARGCLSKATPADELVGQIERVAAGEIVIETARTGICADRQLCLWPGKDAGLSERESEIVALVALGRRNAEIAEALYISIETVKSHLSHSFRKLGLTNRTELAAYALRDDTFRPLQHDLSSRRSGPPPPTQ